MTFVKLRTAKGDLFLNADLIEGINPTEDGNATIEMVSGKKYVFECSAEQMMLTICGLVGAEVNEDEVDI